MEDDQWNLIQKSSFQFIVAILALAVAVQASGPVIDVASAWGAPAWGAPAWGAPSWGAHSWGAPAWGAPAWGAPWGGPWGHAAPAAHISLAQGHQLVGGPLGHLGPVSHLGALAPHAGLPLGHGHAA